MGEQAESLEVGDRCLGEANAHLGLLPSALGRLLLACVCVCVCGMGESPVWEVGLNEPSLSLLEANDIVVKSTNLGIKSYHPCLFAVSLSLTLDKWLHLESELPQLHKIGLE